jgi:hypothetical protein
MMYGGLDGSQAVYPRASNVARSPPDGNELASGSPLTSSLPENSAMAVPSPLGAMKLSCFSAVMPVIGWNWWVKWVAPFSRAQSFSALANASATSSLSFSPFLIVRWRALNTGLGRRSLCVASLNTFAPNASLKCSSLKSIRSSLCSVVAIR